jgi:tetratricopeptide (TPR) repeat protein
MAADPLSLTSLIEAVADGGALDDSVDEEALTVEDRRLLRHLRLVASVAEVHRSLPSEPASPSDSGADDRFAGGKPRRRWGNLELIEKVGEGAFGTVWRARDVLLETEVALKIVEDGSDDQSVRHRVLQEGRALARLRHPSVVSVYGVEEHNGAVGLRMEFIRGTTLEQYVADHGPYGAAEAALIGEDVCRALAAVHSAGLVHRDVKAQNVMREEGGRVVLMDLGSGRLQTDVHGAGLAGTPLCLAPEVLNGAEATERSDLYSLGVLLFHLVTNDYPVRARSIDELRHAHARGLARSLHDLRPDLPRSFVRAVERALDPTPANRFASAGDMGAALAGVKAGASKPRALAAFGWPALVSAALAVMVAGTVYRSWTAAPTTAVRRIAVLPFDTVDDRLTPLAQGIAMELTTSLGQIGALQVVPWSFMKRLTVPRSLREAGETTGADTLVEGTLQEAPGQKDVIVLEVRVYHAGTGAMLWAQRFESRVGGVLQLQADIARQIAARFQILLARREQLLLARFQDIPADAVEVFLKGRQALEAYSNNFDPAISYFRQAIAIYPEFADAYAGLAGCYVLQSGFFGSTSPAEAFARAVQAANQAIALNPELSEAYATRGYARALLAWDWAGAEVDYQHAIAIDPQSANVRTLYSNYLTMVGRHSEAIEQSRIAEARMPLSSIVSRRLGWALFMARDYDGAIAQLEKVLAFEPEYAPAKSLLARTYAMVGRIGEALEYAAPQAGLEALSAQVYAQAGRRDDAMDLIERATLAKPGNPYQIGAAYALMGEPREAVAWMTRAFELHDPSLVNIAFDPRLDSLRSDPEFDALVRRMHLVSQ